MIWFTPRLRCWSETSETEVDQRSTLDMVEGHSGTVRRILGLEANWTKYFKVKPLYIFTVLNFMYACVQIISELCCLSKSKKKWSLSSVWQKHQLPSGTNLSCPCLWLLADVTHAGLRTHIEPWQAARSFDHRRQRFLQQESWGSWGSMVHLAWVDASWATPENKTIQNVPNTCI